VKRLNSIFNSNNIETKAGQTEFLMSGFQNMPRNSYHINARKNTP